MAPPPPPPPCPPPACPPPDEHVDDSDSEDDTPQTVTGFLQKKGRYVGRLNRYFCVLDMNMCMFGCFESEESRKALKRLYIHPYGIALDRSKIDKAYRTNDRAKSKYEFRLLETGNKREHVLITETLEDAKRWCDSFDLTLARARQRPISLADAFDDDWESSDEGDDDDPERMRQREERRRTREEQRKHREAQRRRQNELKARSMREKTRKEITTHPYWCWALRGELPTLLGPNESDLANLDESIPYIILVVPYEGRGQPRAHCWHAKADLMVDEFTESRSREGKLAEAWVKVLNEMLPATADEGRYLDAEAGQLRAWCTHLGRRGEPRAVSDFSLETITAVSSFVIRYSPPFFDGDDDMNTDVRPLIYLYTAQHATALAAGTAERWAQMLNVFRVSYFQMAQDEAVDDDNADQVQASANVDWDQVLMLRGPVFTPEVDAAVEAWLVDSTGVPKRMRSCIGKKRKWHKRREIPTVAVDDERRIFKEDCAYVTLTSPAKQAPFLHILYGFPMALNQANFAREWAHSLGTDELEAVDEDASAVARFCGWGGDDSDVGRRAIWCVAPGATQPARLAGDFVDFDEMCSYTVITAASKTDAADVAIFTVDGMQATRPIMDAARAFADVLVAIRARDLGEDLDSDDVVVRSVRLSQIIGRTDLRRRAWEVSDGGSPHEITVKGAVCEDCSAYTIVTEHGDGSNYLVVVCGQPLGDRFAQAAVSWSTMLAAAEDAGREGANATRYVWEVCAAEVVDGVVEEALPTLIADVSNESFDHENSYIIVAPADAGSRPAVFTMDGAACDPSTADSGHRWAAEVAASVAAAAVAASGDESAADAPTTARPLPSTGAKARRVWICVQDDATGQMRVQPVPAKKAAALSTSDAYIVLFTAQGDVPASVHALCGEGCTDDERATALKWARNLSSLLTGAETDETGAMIYPEGVWAMTQALEPLELHGDDTKLLTFAYTPQDACDEEVCVFGAVSLNSEGAAYATYASAATDDVRGATSAWISMLRDAQLCATEEAPARLSGAAALTAQSRKAFREAMETSMAAVFVLDKTARPVDTLDADAARKLSVEAAHLVLGADLAGEPAASVVLGALAPTTLGVDCDGLAARAIDYAAFVQHLARRRMVALAPADAHLIAGFSGAGEPVPAALNANGEKVELNDSSAYVFLSLEDVDAPLGITIVAGTAAAPNHLASAMATAATVRTYLAAAAAAGGIGGVEPSKLGRCSPLPGLLSAMGALTVNRVNEDGTIAPAGADSLAKGRGVHAVRAGKAVFACIAADVDFESSLIADAMRWASTMSISDLKTRHAWKITGGAPAEIPLSDLASMRLQGDQALVVLDSAHGIVVGASDGCSKTNFNACRAFAGALAGQLADQLKALHPGDGFDLKTLFGDMDGRAVTGVWKINPAGHMSFLGAGDDAINALRAMPADEFARCGFVALTDSPKGSEVAGFCLANSANPPYDLLSNLLASLDAASAAALAQATREEAAAAFRFRKAGETTSLDKLSLQDMYALLAQGVPEAEFMIVAPTDAAGKWAVFALSDAANSAAGELLTCAAAASALHLADAGLLGGSAARLPAPPAGVASRFHMHAFNDHGLGDAAGAEALRRLATDAGALLTVDGETEGAATGHFIHGFGASSSLSDIERRRLMAELLQRVSEDPAALGVAPGRPAFVSFRTTADGVVEGLDVLAAQPTDGMFVCIAQNATAGADGKPTFSVIAASQGADAAATAGLMAAASFIAGGLGMHAVLAENADELAALLRTLAGESALYSVDAAGNARQVTGDETAEELHGRVFIAVSKTGEASIIAPALGALAADEAAALAAALAAAQSLASRLADVHRRIRAGESFAVDSKFDVLTAEQLRAAGLGEGLAYAAFHDGHGMAFGDSTASAAALGNVRFVLDAMRGSGAIELATELAQMGVIGELLLGPGDVIYYIDPTTGELVRVKSLLDVPAGAVAFVKKADGSIVVLMAGNATAANAAAMAAASMALLALAADSADALGRDGNRRIIAVDAQGVPSDVTDLVAAGRLLDLEKDAFIVIAPAGDGSGKPATFLFRPAAATTACADEIDRIAASLRAARTDGGRMVPTTDVVAGVIKGGDLPLGITLCTAGTTEALSGAAARVLDDGAAYVVTSGAAGVGVAAGAAAPAGAALNAHKFAQFCRQALDAEGIFANLRADGADRVGWLVVADESAPSGASYRDIPANQLKAMIDTQDMAGLPEGAAFVVGSRSAGYAQAFIPATAAPAVRRACPGFAAVLRSTGAFDNNDALVAQLLAMPFEMSRHLQLDATKGFERESAGVISADTPAATAAAAAFSTADATGAPGPILVCPSATVPAAYAGFSLPALTCDALAGVFAGLAAPETCPTFAAALRAQTQLCSETPAARVFAVPLGAAGKAKGRGEPTEVPLSGADAATVAAKTIGNDKVVAAVVTNGEAAFALAPRVALGPCAKTGCDLSGLAHALARAPAAMERTLAIARSEPVALTVATILAGATAAACAAGTVTLYRLYAPFSKATGDLVSVRVEDLTAAAAAAGDDSLPADEGAAYVLVHRAATRAQATMDLAIGTAAPPAVVNVVPRALWAARALVEAEGADRAERVVVELPAAKVVGSDLSALAAEDSAPTEGGYKTASIKSVQEWIDTAAGVPEARVFAVMHRTEGDWYVIGTQCTYKYTPAGHLATAAHSARTVAALVAARLLVGAATSGTAGQGTLDMPLGHVFGSAFTSEIAQTVRVFGVTPKGGRLDEIAFDDFKRCEEEKREYAVAPATVHVFAAGVGANAKTSFALSLSGPTVVSAAAPGAFSVHGGSDALLAALAPATVAQFSHENTVIPPDSAAAWRFNRFTSSGPLLATIDAGDLAAVSSNMLSAPLVFAPTPAGESHRAPVFATVPVTAELVASTADTGAAGAADATALGEALVGARAAASVASLLRVAPRDGETHPAETTTLGSLLAGHSIATAQVWSVTEGTCAPMVCAAGTEVKDSMALLALVQDATGAYRGIVIAGANCQDEDLVSAEGWGKLLFSMAQGAGNETAGARDSAGVLRRCWRSRGGIPEPCDLPADGIFPETQAFVVSTDVGGKQAVWVAIGAAASSNSASAVRAYAQMLHAFGTPAECDILGAAPLPATRGRRLFIPVGHSCLPAPADAAPLTAQPAALAGILVQRSPDGATTATTMVASVTAQNDVVGAARAWTSAMARGSAPGAAVVATPRSATSVEVSTALTANGVDIGTMPSTFAVVAASSGVAASFVNVERTDAPNATPVRVFAEVAAVSAKVFGAKPAPGPVLSKTVPALARCSVWTVDPATHEVVTVYAPRADESSTKVNPPTPAQLAAIHAAIATQACIVANPVSRHVYLAENSGSAAPLDSAVARAWATSLRDALTAPAEDIARRADGHTVVWRSVARTVSAGSEMAQVLLPELVPDNETGNVLKRVTVDRQTGRALAVAPVGDEAEAYVLLKRVKCSEDALAYFEGLDVTPVFDVVSAPDSALAPAAAAAAPRFVAAAKTFGEFITETLAGESRPLRLLREEEDRVLYERDQRAIVSRIFRTRDIRDTENGLVAAWVIGARDSSNPLDANGTHLVPGQDAEDEDAYILANGSAAPINLAKAGIQMFDSRFNYVLAARVSPDAAELTPEMAAMALNSDGYIIRTWRGGRSAAHNTAAAAAWAEKLADRVAAYAQVSRDSVAPMHEVDGEETDALISIFAKGASGLTDETEEEAVARKTGRGRRAGPAPLQFFVITGAGYADSLVARLPIRVPTTRTGEALPANELAKLGISVDPDWVEPAWTRNAPPAFTYLPPLDYSPATANAEEKAFYEQWRGYFVIANKYYIITYAPSCLPPPTNTMKARMMQLIGSLKTEYPLARHVMAGYTPKATKEAPKVTGAAAAFMKKKEEVDESEEITRLFYRIIGGAPTSTAIAAAGASRREATRPDAPELFRIDSTSCAYERVKAAGAAPKVAPKTADGAPAPARTGQRLARAMLRTEPDATTGEVAPQIFHLMCHKTLFQYEAPGLVRDATGKTETVPVPAWLSAAARIRARQEMAARGMYDVQLIKLQGRPSDDTLIPLAFESAFAVWGAMPPVASKLAGAADDLREKPDDRFKRNLAEIAAVFSRVRGGEYRYFAASANGVVFDAAAAALVTKMAATEALIIGRFAAAGTNVRPVLCFVPGETKAKGARKVVEVSAKDVSAWETLISSALRSCEEVCTGTDIARIPRIVIAPAKASKGDVVKVIGF